MPFITAVERWRNQVRACIHEVVDPSSTYLHLMDVMKLSVDDLTDVILGIIQKESSGNPDAVGDNGNSVGLMQLNFGAGTPQDMGYDGTKEDLLNPKDNIFFGTMYFLRQLNKYRDIPKALSAYNAGHSTASNIGSYVNPILSFIGEKKT